MMTEIEIIAVWSVFILLYGLAVVWMGYLLYRLQRDKPWLPDLIQDITIEPRESRPYDD